MTAPRNRAAVWLLLALALLLPCRSGMAADDLEQGLKVAYLYNFTRFIEWPAASLGDSFDIVVIADPALARALRALERPDKQVQGRPIRVRAVTSGDRVDGAQILFIGAAAASELSRLRARTAGQPVLLVGDSPGFAKRGVAINFFLDPDILGDSRRLRFEINPKALAGRQLRVSAQLYDVAEIVR
jgi:hypothetical protein